MPASQTEFQAFADTLVEHVISAAELSEIEIELYFCLQQVPDHQAEVGLSYLLRNGAKDVFLATDAKGRMWYCDCAQQVANEISPTTDFDVVSDVLLEALSSSEVAIDPNRYN